MESINFYEEALFGAGENCTRRSTLLFSTLQRFLVSQYCGRSRTLPNQSLDGLATVVGPTDLAIGAVVGVNGANYAFNLLKGQIFSLDVASGNTSLVTDTDPTAGMIRGAATAIPEPASIVLTGVGLAATLVWRRRKLYLRD